MNEQKPVGDLPFIEEANREAWKQSVFWKNDHPPETSVGHRAPPVPTTIAELLDGARTSLEQARGMMRTAESRLAQQGDLAGRVTDGVRAEIRPFMVNAMIGVIRADAQRARSEVRHWNEYVTYYERQTGSAPKMGGIVGDMLNRIR